jgi:hypothetical protein
LRLGKVEELLVLVSLRKFLIKVERGSYGSGPY